MLNFAKSKKTSRAVAAPADENSSVSSGMKVPQLNLDGLLANGPSSSRNHNQAFGVPKKSMQT